MPVWPWIVQNYKRIIGTGVVMAGWCAVTYPTEYMWLPRLYYKYTPMGVSDIAQNTKDLINEVLVDLNTSKSAKYIEANKLLFAQGMMPFPEFQHKGDINTGTAFIALTSGFEKTNISRLLPAHIAKKMLLPESIQRYAIARQLLYAQDNFETLRCILGATCILLYSVLAYRGNKVFAKPVALETLKQILRLKTSQEQLILFHRMVRIPVLMIPLANLYWAVLYGYSRSVERKTDETISKLGIEYIKGGYEFYSNSLEWNKKKTLPIHYKNFTKDGDYVQGYIHKKTVPLSSRRDYFADLLKQHQQNSQAEKKMLLSLPVIEKQP